MMAGFFQRSQESQPVPLLFAELSVTVVNQNGFASTAVYLVFFELTVQKRKILHPTASAAVENLKIKNEPSARIKATVQEEKFIYLTAATAVENPNISSLHRRRPAPRHRAEPEHSVHQIKHRI